MSSVGFVEENAHQIIIAQAIGITFGDVQVHETVN
jgi:hypothetical protein